MMRPNMTPLQASEILQSSNHAIVILDGWSYMLDGPQMAPREAWSPLAWKGSAMFVPAGEVGEEITPETDWVMVT